MEKKSKTITVCIVLTILAALSIGGALWYNTPVRVINIKPEDVSEISIFDGSTGQGGKTVEEADIEYFIDHLSALRMKRGGVSLGYMGYRFRVAIVTKKGARIEFIINAADTVRRDPFFYDIEEGEIDLDFIEALLLK